MSYYYVVLSTNTCSCSSLDLHSLIPQPARNPYNWVYNEDVERALQSPSQKVTYSRSQSKKIHTY